MNFRLHSGAMLLFLSGLCALIYQICWLRELRLIFGGATLAVSAVLAIFMAGIGLGSLFLGQRAENSRHPLRLYGLLELGIGGAAILSPILIAVSRMIYLSLGGEAALGTVGASLLRLFLAAVVLGLPTFLMGGTLPAMIRAVEEESDLGRRQVGTLYGLNTLGAVFGCIAATFFMLEHFGLRTTIWSAGFLNLLIGFFAIRQSGRLPALEIKPGEDEPSSSGLSALWSQLFGWYERQHLFVLVAAALCGFVFIVMEQIWYRMLAPLLGGSTYTFGLILGVALLGIGLGGWLFGRRRQSQRTGMAVFALTCSLEALLLILPFALGDQLALLAALLRPLGNLGFYGLVAGWLLILSIIVLPVAVVAGYQFPVLIGLLGSGRDSVARHTGHVYAWNTAGAILGALGVGYLLLPVLGATTIWRLAAVLLAALAGGAGLLSYFSERRHGSLGFSFICLLLALLFTTSVGPTSVWRHMPIGAGRVFLTDLSGNDLRNWMHKERRHTIWEADGRESAVAIKDNDGLSFVINGKPDGNAVQDADMQIMGPMVGAILHPQPRRSLVIGLGTGSSPGWLAAIDSMEQVDVMELEPAILEVARRSAPVNRNVLANPKVNIMLGDAREMMQVSDQKYDLIFSEPSNPYRAGVASLFTQEFYGSVAERLADDGFFTQWVQGYEIDYSTFRTIIATLYSVFPNIQIWNTMGGDLLFVCSKTDAPFKAEMVRQRIATEPYREALLHAWGVNDLDGFISHCLAYTPMAEALAVDDISKGLINTDDRMLVEFGFARTLGQHTNFSLYEVRYTARAMQALHPALASGAVTVDGLIDNYMLIFATDGLFPPPDSNQSSELQMRRAAYNAANEKSYDARVVLQAWSRQARPPRYPFEFVMLAEAYAELADDQALQLVEKFKADWPATANFILARYAWRNGSQDKALSYAQQALTDLHKSPWGIRKVNYRGLELLFEMVEQQPAVAKSLFEGLKEPFAVSQFEMTREFLLLSVADDISWKAGELALMQTEPHIEWGEKLLTYRLQCYRQTGNPLAAKAEADLLAFLRAEPQFLMPRKLPPPAQ